jgi:alanyl-tRNA synthetase
METTLNYLINSYIFIDKAMILHTNQDEIGKYITLNQTIFYPQGGGQPCDSGNIQVDDFTIPIRLVKKVKDEVRHYTDQIYVDIANKEAVLMIDQDKRLLHAKLHTAGHLISNIIEKIYAGCQAIKGHHYLALAYVEFITTGNPQFVMDEINYHIKEAVNNDYHLANMEVTSEQLLQICPNLPFAIKADKMIRIIRIGDFPFSPCAGTHIKSTAELFGLNVTKIKTSNNNVKVTYQLN